MSGSTDYHAVIAAPFGKLGVRMNGPLLAGLQFLPATYPELAPSQAATAAACAHLAAYLDNAANTLDLPFRAEGTPFQQRVWQALRTIPVGTTLTYGALADRIGSGPRAVANACGANPIPLVIPCHRVVASRGPGGFMQGRTADALQIKHWLLDHERRRPAAD